MVSDPYTNYLGADVQQWYDNGNYVRVWYKWLFFTGKGIGLNQNQTAC